LAPGRSHQGIIGEALPAPISSLSEMLSRARSSGEPALLLVVDQIQDPMNLGSLIRSAEVAGAHGVVITERRTAPLSGAVSKASAGAVHHLPVGQVANLSAVFAELGRAQVWTLGLVAGARGSIYDCDLTIPLAIVVGSEGRGLRPLTEKRVDMVASIPTHGHVASLNASVAGAITLFETQRQRICG
jgi:23S rRNA (guanosine2251-2'-O)-methyltransferase